MGKAALLFNTKMHSNSIPMKFSRSRTFGDLVNRLVISCLPTFSKDFSSEATGPISLQFHIQPPGKGEKKLYLLSSSHDQDGRHTHIE